MSLRSQPWSIHLLPRGSSPGGAFAAVKPNRPGYSLTPRNQLPKVCSLGPLTSRGSHISHSPAAQCSVMPKCIVSVIFGGGAEVDQAHGIGPPRAGGIGVEHRKVGRGEAGCLPGLGAGDGGDAPLGPLEVKGHPVQGM